MYWTTAQDRCTDHKIMKKITDEFRPLLEQLYVHERFTVVEVFQHLKEEYGFQGGMRTVERRLKQWGLQHYSSLTETDTPLLRTRIGGLILTTGLKDDTLLRVLRREGFEDLTADTLKRIRLDMGIKRINFRTAAEKQAYQSQLQHIIERELATGVPAQYGRNYFYTYLKNKGVPVVRDCMFRILKEVDPVGVSARRPYFVPRRDRVGKLLIPGPNYMWCVDGHLKLARFGIGVYANVDGYSRFIVSYHVGRSVTTGISIVKQYIEAVKGIGLRPLFIRSDRGTETMLMANAQWLLAQSMDPDISFKDIYRYGSSKSNSRIESWWEKLSSGQLRQWREYFRKLESDKIFDRKDESDLISIAFIYMEQIRNHVDTFVEVWNRHKIRKQPNRPYLITGEPYVNYHHPELNNSESEDCGVPFEHETLERIEDTVNDYDPLESLTSDTINWCSCKLSIKELPPPYNFVDVTENGDPVHYAAYMALRKSITRHMRHGNVNPTLARVNAPRDAYDWAPDRGVPGDKTKKPEEEEARESETSEYEETDCDVECSEESNDDD